MKKITPLILILLSFLPLRAYATDINCSSASTVQTAINAASSGDTLTCTAGGTWSTNISIPATKGITLDGGGYTIAHGSALNAPMITIANNASTTSRITNFIFTDSTAFRGYSSSFITVTGGFSNAKFRIDHNTFSHGNGETMIRVHQAFGVIDSNTFNVTAVTEIIHNEAYGPSVATGWGETITPGSAEALYIETNTFNNNMAASAGAMSACQNYYGARTVFRYNTVYLMNFDVHGNTPRNGRWWEVYENNWYGNGYSIDKILQLRGGSGVAFHNTWTANGSAMNTGVKFWEEHSGTYPIEDQIGRGKDQALDPAYVWNNAFSGSNFGTGTNGWGITEVTAGTFQLDRDFYISDSDAGARPGYTAYTYPHPLTGADTTPDAFSFTDNTDVAPSTVIYSDSITVTGIDDNTSITSSGTGCFYQVNGAGSWLTTGGDNVYLNDTIALKTTSLPSASSPQQTSCTLTLGGSVSDTWYVTTIAVPNIPNLISPPEDDTDVSRPVAFSWSAITGAELYQIQIATDSAFTNIVIDVQTINTTYEATTLLPGMRYYWRVRALQ